MLEEYVNYLKDLQIKIDSHFEDQKDFIACKSGCGICCKSSYYPCSQLEYSYIQQGMENIDKEQKKHIQDRAIQVIKDRKEFLKHNPHIMQFVYTCPLLINNACCIYKNRPMMCRSHGLIYNDAEKTGKINAPYCMLQGLNYANVWDEKLKGFSDDKIKKLDIKSYPQSYDLTYSSMMGASDGIDFGEVRMLVEWIVMDIPNYERLIK